MIRVIYNPIGQGLCFVLDDESFFVDDRNCDSDELRELMGREVKQIDDIVYIPETPETLVLFEKVKERSE